MLTARQKDILLAIIRDYTKTGLPVGSKSLVHQLPQQVSSATVRNEMSTLEHKNLLEKTHLSSGRIPSVNGYRYYINHMISPVPVNQTGKNIIKHALDFRFSEIDSLVKHSANILSNLTNYTAMALRPERARKRTLSGFRLVPLNDDRAMAILVTDNGEIQDKIFRMSDSLPFDQVKDIVNLINNDLIGSPISTVLNQLESDVPDDITRYLDTPDGFFDTFNDVLNQIAKDQFYIGGELNLLNFASHDDARYIKSMYSLLNHANNVSNFLGNPDKPISVKMGSDFHNNLLKNYSVITGTYDVGKYGKGMIAVLGPTRMPYAKIIGIVDVFRRELGKRMLKYYRHLH